MKYDTYRSYTIRMFVVLFGFILLLSYSTPVTAAATVNIKHSSDWNCVHTDDVTPDTLQFWASSRTVTTSNKFFSFATNACSPYATSSISDLSAENRSSGYRVTNASSTVIYDWSPSTGPSFWSPLGLDVGLLSLLPTSSPTSTATSTATSTIISATSTYKFVFSHYSLNDTYAQLLDILQIIVVLVSFVVVGRLSYKAIKALVS